MPIRGGWKMHEAGEFLYSTACINRRGMRRSATTAWENYINDLLAGHDGCKTHKTDG
jgi:hypothetical protein